MAGFQLAPIASIQLRLIFITHNAIDSTNAIACIVSFQVRYQDNRSMVTHALLWQVHMDPKDYSRRMSITRGGTNQLAAIPLHSTYDSDRES